MDGGCFRISPGGDADVRARLRPAAEDALFVPPDDLAAAEVYRVPDRHLMPAAAQLRRKVGGEGPVSYTHLDVYKRQSRGTVI